jgi:nicotinate-nucleotide adenylyltransferase
VGDQMSLVWIMGGDQFERFDTWRDWQLIPALAHIALARRAGRPPRPNPALASLLERRRPAAALGTAPAGAIVEFDMTPVDVSATEVRRLLGQHETPEVVARLQSAVPKPVLDYIRAHHLYR